MYDSEVVPQTIDSEAFVNISYRGGDGIRRHSTIDKYASKDVSVTRRLERIGSMLPLKVLEGTRARVYTEYT